MAPSRSFGRALLAFGTIGLVLLAASAILVLVTLGSVSATASDLGRERDRLAGMVGPASASLRSSATAARNAGTSLTASATAARDGSTLMTQLAGSLDQLATLSDISVLGQHPFGSAGTSFRDTAARSRTLADNLASTATSLDANVGDAGRVAGDLETLATQLDALEADLARSPGAPPPWAWIGLDVVAVGLIAWLAVMALACIRLGWRWSRRG